MNNSKFAIYRLCINEKSVEKVKRVSEKYHFENSRLVTGPDYFTFLNDIIKNCEFDYALVCHEDVFLPFDIKNKVARCIERIDAKFGEEGWGVAGNAGLEYLSNEVIRYIRDPHSVVSSPLASPFPAISIDGNTMLLNIKNLKKKKILPPKELTGFHFYDLTLLVECYKNNLVCVIDPNLFVVHNSGGNQEAFDKEAKTGKFKDYWKENFINNAVFAINGVVEIENSLEYLGREHKDKRKDFYKLVEEVIANNQKKEDIKIYIIIRTQLKRIDFLDRLLDSCVMANLYNGSEVDLRVILAVNNTGLTDAESKKITDCIKAEYKELEIETLFVKEDEVQYPRVKAIKDGLGSISEKDAYVWIVDDDDFIFPNNIGRLTKMFESGRIVLADVIRFDEEWDKSNNTFPVSSVARLGHYMTRLYFKGFIHDNHAPINAFIFPYETLKKVFEDYELLGDYYEDYAIELAAQKYGNVKHYPLPIAGVSFHNDENQTVLVEDRTHWDHSLATFMSELVSKGLLNSWEYDMLKNHEEVSTQNKRWQPIFRLAKPFIKISRRLGIIK